MRYKSALSTEASGKLGGLQARPDPKGRTLRAPPRHPARRPPSSPGSRSALAQAVAAWSTSLTPSDRDGWELYGKHTPRVDRFGDPRPLTGRQAFLRRALLELGAGRPITTAPPTLFGPFVFEATLTLAIGPNQATITWAQPTDSGFFSPAFVTTHLYGPIPATRTGHPPRLAEARSFPGFNFSGADGARTYTLNHVLLPGAAYLLRYGSIDPSGRPTPPRAARATTQ